jgi:hypothetical protein
VRNRNALIDRSLTEKEIDRLMDCTRKRGRHGHRDTTGG